MRFMIIVKGNAETEAGVMPTEQELLEMGAFNEQLVNAGVMQAGEGLHPTSNAARVSIANGTATVTDGPFPESKDLIAGFWIWKVNSREEAVEWARKCPSPSKGSMELEIRQIFEAEDFGDAYTPEVREQEERLRARVEGQQG